MSYYVIATSCQVEEQSAVLTIAVKWGCASHAVLGTVGKISTRSRGRFLLFHSSKGNHRVQRYHLARLEWFQEI